MTEYKLKQDMVADSIRESLLRGKYRKGDRLPTDSEMAEMFEVDKRTVAMGLNKLASEGLLSRAPRRGTIITADLAKPVSNAVALISRSQGDVFLAISAAITRLLMAKSLYPVAIDNSVANKHEDIMNFIEFMTATQQPSGFIVQGYTDVPYDYIEKETDIFRNTVFIIRYHYFKPIENAGYVLTDTEEAGRILAEYFHQRGYRNIAFPALREPRYNGPYSSMQVQIMQSLTHWCREYGMSFNEGLFWRLHAGADRETALREVFKSKDHPDAFFAYSDSTLTNTFQPVLRKISPNLADEIECVGMFDTPIAENHHFASLNIQEEKIAETAIKMLLGEIEKSTIFIKPELKLHNQP